MVFRKVFFLNGVRSTFARLKKVKKYLYSEIYQNLL